MINGLKNENLINYYNPSMKTKILTVFLLTALSSGFLNAQTDCNRKLALFSQNAKTKQYKEAKSYYDVLIKDCQDANLAIYQYGDRMFKALVDETKGAEKDSLVQGWINNYKLRLKNFPSKTKKGQTHAHIAQVMYDNGIGTKEEQYKAFDQAWKEDNGSFNSPKSLYTYFSLLVDLQDAGKRDLQDVFEKYDELNKKIDEVSAEQAKRADPLIKKQENGEELTNDEKRTLKNSEIYLKNFSIVQQSVDGKLGQRADCDNLIPLYEKDFEEKKEDLDWLEIATKRLSAKDCTDDPMFVKLVTAQNDLKPSAETALYLGQLAEKDGNAKKAMKYYNQSAELQEDPSARAKVYYKIASNYKNKGNLSNARSFYRKALNEQPSLGQAYLKIASMYANSANSCGDNVFNKRAVYWLAAEVAARAGRVNPALKSSANKAAAAYRGRAPQKSDIFQKGVKEGSTINIGCWIGESVRVPSI